MRRVILVSGKGGVGKTTVAAATAIAAAHQGYRTIAISFDLAHSLSDSFDLERRLFDQNRGLPVPVMECLDIQEIDVQEELQRNWGAVHGYMATLFASAGLSDIVADEVAMMPGMEDLVALIAVNQYYREGVYDVIVVDCPPTSESLRFLNIMASIDWYVRKRFNIDRALVKVARPIAKRLTEYQLPEDAYFDTLKGIFDRIEGIDELLHDPEVTTVRLVTNAEKMVVRETQRAYTYFCMYGMTIDQVVINRLISSAEGYFARWAETHAGYAAELEQYFDPVPVVRLPLFADEVVGIPALERLAEALFAGADPTRRSVEAPPYAFEKHGDAYRLIMHLPFVDRAEIELSRVDHDLVVRIGTFRRRVVLPRALAQLPHTRAKLEGRHLHVDFAAAPQGGATRERSHVSTPYTREAP